MRGSRALDEMADSYSHCEADLSPRGPSLKTSKKGRLSIAPWGLGATAPKSVTGYSPRTGPGPPVSRSEYLHSICPRDEWEGG